MHLRLLTSYGYFVVRCARTEVDWSNDHGHWRRLQTGNEPTVVVRPLMSVIHIALR